MQIFQWFDVAPEGSGTPASSQKTMLEANLGHLNVTDENLRAMDALSQNLDSLAQLKGFSKNT